MTSKFPWRPSWGVINTCRTLSKYKIFKTHIKGSIPLYILNVQNDIIVKINMLYKNEFL